jgi:hypothetical protein
LTLSSLAPSSTAAGGADFTLTVNGSGFDAGTLVAWNGSNRSTTFVSATQLTASIPAADIAAAGTAQVSAVSAASGTSSPLTFTITPAVGAASCLVNHATHYDLPGRTYQVDMSFTYNDSRQITQFGQVGGGATVNVTYDAQGKISGLESARVTQVPQYTGAFITRVGSDPSSPTYSWNLEGFGELDSMSILLGGTRGTVTTAWAFDATGAVQSQQLISTTDGTQDQWAVSLPSPVAPLRSPFLGTPEQRFLYFYGLYGSAVGPEFLVGSFLSTSTFESFGYSSGQKKHLEYYDFEYTVDADGKVTKIVGYQTDGPTPVAQGAIELGYDCR